MGVGKILYVGSGFRSVNPIFKGFDTVSVEVPERFLDEEEAAALASQARFDQIDLIFSEHITSIPVLLKIIDKHHKSPIIFVPHVNPYPVKNFLYVFSLLCKAQGNVLLVSGSKSSANIYSELFGANPVVLPTYGVDSQIFCAQNRRVSRSKLGLDKDSRILLYTGRIAPDKNIGGLFALNKELLKELGDIILILTYNFKVDWYIQHLLNTWEPENVKIMNVERELLKYVYGAADLFVSCSTSFYETLGRSPLEAIACGVPAVVPNWIGFNQYIKRGSSSGSLVDVEFFDEPLYQDKNYAMVNLGNFVSECEVMLDMRDGADPRLPPELSQREVFSRYSELIEGVLGGQMQKPMQTRLSGSMAEELLAQLGVKNVLDAEKAAARNEDEFRGFDYKSMFYKLFYDKANIG